MAVYDYGDFEVVRFQPKGFAQRRKDGTWGLGNVSPHLYRRQELLAAPIGETVWIPEGEKDTERVRSLGLVATCNPLGAGKWRDDYSHDLAGRSVIVLPDDDEVGHRHAQQVAASVARVATSVKVVPIPRRAKDVSDWLDQGHNLQDLLNLAAVAPPWTPAGDNHRAETAQASQGDYHLTDVGNAKRWVAEHVQESRYCYPWHTWLVWTGQRWENDTTGEVERRAKSVVKAMFREAADMMQQAAQAKAQGNDAEADGLSAKAAALWKHATKSEQAPRIVAMMEMARSEPGIAISPDTFDRDPWLLNCENGTVDLHSGHLRPRKREDYLTKMCPINFDPNANLPLWDRFLIEAIPDEETRAYVQRCAGATIMGRADDDILLFCRGEGGTGKGTLLNAVRGALGDYAATAELETFTTRHDPHAPQPDLARLRGRRMVAISEVNTGGTVALLKRATGGDPILTRSHHQESFEFVPQFTVWIIANDRPRVPDTDSGIWRRLREIPFLTKFKHPDPAIRRMLSDPTIAGPAVLAWCVKGCLAWQKEGVGHLPQQVQRATQDYKGEMNPLREWLEECCLPIPTAWTPFKALLASYLAWSKENAVEHPMGRNILGSRLKAHLQEKRHGHNTERGYLGIALRAAVPKWTPPDGQSCIWPDWDADISQNVSKGEGPVGFQNSSLMEEDQESKSQQLSAKAETDGTVKCQLDMRQQSQQMSAEMSAPEPGASDVDV